MGFLHVNSRQSLRYPLHFHLLNILPAWSHLYPFLIYSQSTNPQQPHFSQDNERLPELLELLESFLTIITTLPSLPPPVLKTELEVCIFISIYISNSGKRK